jgi:hypothetical protein
MQGISSEILLIKMGYVINSRKELSLWDELSKKSNGI